jgi:hypothetical protein
MVMSRFGVTSLLGVLVFVITVWLATISPKSIAHPSDGDMRDPVLAFEMVSTPAELTAVIGEDGGSYADLRARMNKVNEIDFVYMTAYGAFIAVFFLAVAQQRNDRRWLILSVVGIVAMLADMRENMALLALTRDGADIVPLLHALVTATWVKWFALAIAALGAGLALFEDRSMPTMRLIGAIVAIAAAAFTVASWFDPFKFPQYMALGIFVTWLMQVIYAYRISRGPAPQG